ncbi:MAG: hypothetical protein U5N58_05180 [Actinomycetota bacterium]|nr:hypothetical protein [Actinomycetota bacterium]
MPLRLVKRLRLVEDQAELFIEEEAVNLSSVDLEVVWGHHLAYGRPFLGPGCTINIPAAKGKVYEHKSALDENIGPGTTFSWPHLPLTDGDTVDLSVIPGKMSRLPSFCTFPAWTRAGMKLLIPGRI